MNRESDQLRKDALYSKQLAELDMEEETQITFSPALTDNAVQPAWSEAVGTMGQGETAPEFFSSCYDEQERDSFPGSTPAENEIPPPSSSIQQPLALLHETELVQGTGIQHGIPVLYHGPESYDCQQSALPTAYLEAHAAAYNMSPGSGTHSFPPYSGLQSHTGVLRPSDPQSLAVGTTGNIYGIGASQPGTESAGPLGRYPNTISNQGSAETLNESSRPTSRAVMSRPSMLPHVPQHQYAAPTQHHVGRSGAPDMSALLDWETTKTVGNVMDSQRRPVKIEIQAKIDKGFFKAEDHWTCYRRNYFAVLCCYSIKLQRGSSEALMPCFLSNGDNSQVLISRFAICISACIHNEEDRAVELVQHTPKRDKGPINTPRLTILQPNPSGRLGPMPMGGMYSPVSSYYAAQSSCFPSVPASSSPPATGSEEQTTTTFERIQFKKATANNGKRRAHQQFFRVRVELFAGVLKPSAINMTQANRDSDVNLYDWTKVAVHMSAQMVVRGRSPGHYTDSEQRNQANRGGSGRGGGHGHGRSGGPGNAHNNASSAGGGAGGMHPYDPSSQQGYGAHGPQHGHYRGNPHGRYMGNNYHAHSVGHFSPMGTYTGMADANMASEPIGPVHHGQPEPYQEHPGFTNYNMGLLSPNSMASTPKPQLLPSPSHLKMEQSRRFDFKNGQHFIPRSDPNCTLPYMPPFESEVPGGSWMSGNMTARDMQQRWPHMPQDPLRLKHESHSPS